MDKSKIPLDQRQALGALMDDHRAVKKLFKSFEEAGSSQEKREIAAQTCHQLMVHAEIEEEIFYPALRDVSPDLEHLLDEATVEHQVAKDLITVIQSNAADDILEASYKVLTEYVGHHIEEEEGELFKAVIKQKVNLRDVAEKLAARKQALLTVTA